MASRAPAFAPTPLFELRRGFGAASPELRQRNAAHSIRVILKHHRDGRGGIVSAGLTVHITMADLLSGWPAAGPALAHRGMACVGCPMARFETVEKPAAAYGFDLDELLRDVAAGSEPSRHSIHLRGRKRHGRRPRHQARKRRISS